MPRPNRPRTLGSERALAARIQLLCGQEGISYPELAKRMTEEENCPIQPTALYKLHGPRPRRITVNELVAIANVFDLSTDDLLRPIEVVRKEWADEVARDLVRATDGLYAAYAETLRAAIRLAEVAIDSPALFDFVRRRFDDAQGVAADERLLHRRTPRPGRTAGKEQWFAEFAEIFEGQYLSEIAVTADRFFHQALALADTLIQAERGGAVR